MDFPTVQKQLNNLPSTFKRPSTNFLQLIDSISAMMTRYTLAADGTNADLTLTTAAFGWLDVWGLLFGIQRRANEADSVYLARISYSLTAGAGPAQAIANWISTVWGVFASVTENLPNVGYVITFPAVVTLDQVNAIIAGLSQIRPAGVPFAVYINNVGTYLDTINFYDAGRVTGAYLGQGAGQVYPSIAGSTNSSPALFPTLYLTDPTLNPNPPT